MELPTTDAIEVFQGEPDAYPSSCRSRMKLHRVESGSGSRVALLIHGMMCSSADWWELTPLLVARGFRVLAPDLRGHGHSPRADSYAPKDYARDVIESMDETPELIIGHSLGARVVSDVVATLSPQRAIYVDPPWSPLDQDRIDLLAPPLSEVADLDDDALGARLRAFFPRWSEESIRVDLIDRRLWDPTAAAGMADVIADAMPFEAVVPSLVVAAQDSIVFRGPEQLEAAKRGFEIRVTHGVRSHYLIRDDVNLFWSTLNGWV